MGYKRTPKVRVVSTTGDRHRYLAAHLAYNPAYMGQMKLRIADIVQEEDPKFDNTEPKPSGSTKPPADEGAVKAPAPEAETKQSLIGHLANEDGLVSGTKLGAWVEACDSKEQIAIVMEGETRQVPTKAAEKRLKQL